MCKFKLLLAILIVTALIVGCAKKDPVKGTWEGRLILTDVFQKTDTSDLRLELNNDKGIVSGKVTASKFNWQNASIKTGAYVSSTKEIGITATVGGNDAELILTGTVAENSMSGNAATNAPRTGTWNATKK